MRLRKWEDRKMGISHTPNPNESEKTKYEARNPKQIQMNKIQNTKCLGIRTFEFRNSIFDFFH